MAPKALQLVHAGTQHCRPVWGINRASGAGSGSVLRPRGRQPEIGDRALKARAQGNGRSQPSYCWARVITGWRWRGSSWARAAGEVSDGSAASRAQFRQAGES